jgi:hypothetical protein
MRLTSASLALIGLVPLALAAPAPAAAPVPEITPAPAPVHVAIEERQLLGGVVGGLVGGLVGLIDGVAAGLINDVEKAVSALDPAGVVSALVQIEPKARPTAVSQVLSRQSAIWASPTGRKDIYPAIATQVAVGLGPLLDDTLQVVLGGGFATGENSIDNNNPKPPTTIYPRKESGDAPYSLSQEALRKAIFIPPGFTYGKKPPVLFVPGTGSYGGTTFSGNLRKLLTGKPFADPVWLNVPGAMLGDAQLNAEYIAYAINYISSVSKNSKQIAVISWSQGGLDTQWALKYWPSTRKVVRNFLPVSPDFKGTIFANALCLSLDPSLSVLCDPGVIQQEATSNYVAALRSGGGDSAYVPTTTFYSGFFDEIVEPQQGTAASAYMLDARNVGVANYEVQVTCAGELGGSFYGHAGVLFNPVVYALIVDALKYGGIGRIDRINRKQVCSTYQADGLDLDDVLATTGLIPTAAVLLLTYPQKLLAEPPLMAYAK